MNEQQFETELIQYLSGGTVSSSPDFEWGSVKEKPADYVVKTKLWKYEPSIKTTEQLWENFKRILEQHNQNTLDHPLSVVEFNQVIKIISDIQTPYQRASSCTVSTAFRKSRSTWMTDAMCF